MEDPDLGFNLASVYIETHVARNMDWLDNKVHDTHTDSWWCHQADGDWNVVEWPLPLDFSYSTSSVAYTHSNYGLPVGDLNHFPDKLAEWSTLSVEEDSEGFTPSEFSLSQNYPNPFNPTTTLKYDLPEDSFVDIMVYDMLGNMVSNLINTNQSSGYKSIQWNATNNQGEPVSAGVYLYKIQAGDFVDTKKMILLK